MSATVQDIEVPKFNMHIPRGMAKSYQIAVTAATVIGGPQEPVNLTTRSLIFLVKRLSTIGNLPVPDNLAVLVKRTDTGDIILIDPPNGLALVTIKDTDTLDPALFPEGCIFQWGVKLYPDEAVLNWGRFHVTTLPNLS